MKVDYVRQLFDFATLEFNEILIAAGSGFSCLIALEALKFLAGKIVAARSISARPTPTLS